ncbi:Activator of Hsp90 ATPase homolog 1-like protein [Rhodococcus tukisamuensis]|uniref:Activator of Hsp90 ATPase homolog 1-like protein n=1 Tax=Rhodococcus tukisamuensis TaxID=168276 RepID=A0A1G7AUZ1_9NOCA|nr:Activator of Hsp90 ATPase homolog 1-like protein [Rhodococcus tukisamuensis]
MTTQHTPAAATVSTPGDRDIHVERVFNATRDRVWAAYTEPDQLAQWWGRGNPLDVERWEFERGGHWRFVEQRQPCGARRATGEGRLNAAALQSRRHRQK